MAFPILQFGTSRFLQSHVDLFIDQRLRRRPGRRQNRRRPDDGFAGERAPPRLLQCRQTLQASTSAASLEGARVDEWVEVASIGRGVDANADWPALEGLFVEARWIVSNTGDRGYELSEDDRYETPVPRSFPGKLTKLLHARFLTGRPAPTLFPCELIEANGDKLRALVT